MDKRLKRFLEYCHSEGIRIEVEPDLTEGDTPLWLVVPNIEISGAPAKQKVGVRCHTLEGGLTKLLEILSSNVFWVSRERYLKPLMTLQQYLTITYGETEQG